MTGAYAGVDTDDAGHIEVYRASDQQRLLWRGSAAGAVELRFTVPTGVDAAAAWTVVAGRHEVLRTRVEAATESGEPVQRVSGEASTRTGHLVGPERAGDVDRWVLRLPALATDPTGLLVIAAELGDALAGRRLADDPLQYSEYADWQQTLVGTPEQVAAAEEQARRAEHPETPLALQYPGAFDGGPRTAVTRQLPATGLRELAAYNRAGIEAALLAGWQALVALSSASESVVTEVSVPARGDDLDSAVGPYEKWARLIGPVSTDRSLADLARTAAAGLVELSASGDFLPAGGVAARIGFGFVRIPATEGGLGVLDVEPEVYRHSLAVFCAEFPERVVVRLTATDGVLPEGYLDQLADQYVALLTGAAAEPDLPIGRVALADPPAAAPPPPVRRGSGPIGSLQDRVHRVAVEHPDRIAVAGADTSLSYVDLDSRAAALASRLRGLGVGVGDRVGLWAAAEPASVVAILGVLGSGAAFVPVDPALPVARAVSILGAAGCRYLLATETDVPRPDGVEVLPVVEPEPIGGPHSTVPPEPITPLAPAYVLFTSGSTGTPKGVVVTRAALENYLSAAAETYLSDGAGTVVPTSLAFDLTVTALLLPLGAGQRVVLDPALRRLDALAARLADESDLTLLKLTPSHLDAVTELLGPDVLAGLTRTLVVGGEALDARTTARWRSRAGGTRLINEYGPTEATVGCSIHEVTASDPDDGPVPIGKPFAEAELQVLDPLLRPVPPGVVGELFIGGPGLATGYLDDPRATADRFVPHPWSATPGERLYRSGDLVARRPDGTLLYLGRIDDQVKIRGHRVELGEVRAVLNSHPAVAASAVLLDVERDGSPRLVAYLVPTVAVEAGAATWASVRAHLEAVLPKAMIPDAARWVAALPLTANHKLDLAALHEIETTSHDEPTHRPLSEDEARVARHVGELVRADITDPAASFFAVGGHSMLAIQLVARLNDEFGTRLLLGDLLEDTGAGLAADSVERLAALAVQRRSTDRDGDPVVTLRAGSGPVPLFCAHSAGGEVAELRAFAARVTSNGPVLGLQDPMPRAGDWSVDAAGRRFGAAVIVRAGGSPVDLAGWSMGGLIALETAREVERAGGRVRRLVLVDCYPSQVLDAVHTGPDDDGHAHPALAGFDRRAETWTAVDRADFTGRQDWYERHQNAAAAYRPGRFERPVLVVFAADQPIELREAARAEWARLFPDVRFRTVPGDHFSVLAEPDGLVRALADDDEAGPAEPRSDAT